MSTQLVLLGTGGGPTPKPTRGAPASAIQVGGATYVIDCGNGVANRLVQAKIPLASLKAVFITHHHVDHNADVGILLHASWSQLETPVQVFGPPPLRRVLRHFFEMQAYDIALRSDDEGRRPLRELVQEHEIACSGQVYSDEHVSVTAITVSHPPIAHALGYRFETADRSIAFSGDTRMTRATVELARGADVLVHEAIYSASIGAHADNFRATRWASHMLDSHTTAHQAGQIAAEAGVDALVLTHLFPPDPSVSDDAWAAAAGEAYDGTVIVGRDFLVV